MTLPHVDLGNSLTDASQGANSFAAGLLAQRQRQQTLAMQEALAASKQGLDTAEIQHYADQAPLLQAQGQHAQAQAAAEQAGNAPADDADETRLREVDPTAPKGVYQGYNKAQAAEHTKVIADYMARKASLSAINQRFEDRGVLSTDANGNVLIVHPNQVGGGQAPGNPMQVPGAAHPVNAVDRKAAGSWQAALSAKDDMQRIMTSNPEIAGEVAKALSLPNIGRLSFIPGTGEGLQQALDAFRFSGASPQAQVFLKRMFDFSGIVGPARYGLRGMQNPRTLQQLWSDFGLGQFGLTREGIQAAMRNQDNAVNQLQEMAGPNAASQAQEVFPQTQSTIGATTVSPYGYQKR